tara:strand:+ start:336 stop:551 length:216 start_codon:yes stop_codon:yes gene_type:complete
LANRLVKRSTALALKPGSIADLHANAAIMIATTEYLKMMKQAKSKNQRLVTMKSLSLSDRKQPIMRRRKNL